jgi:hypothetical protein
MKLSRGLIFPTTTLIDFVSEISVNPWASVRVSNSRYAEIWVNLERVEIDLNVEYLRLPEIMA